jgi:uncharacterized protein YxjI
MLLDHDRFILKEQVRLIRTVDAYDIFDPSTGQQLGHVQETPNSFIAFLRLIINKNWMPTTVVVTDQSGQTVFTMHRGGFLFKSRIDIHDGAGNLLGYFQSRFWTLVGKLDVFDHHGNLWAQVGGGRRWFFDYRFTTPEGLEIGHVTKQWKNAMDVLKDLFTSADTFLVETAPDFAEQAPAKMLMLGAAIAIDMVFKEQGGSDNIVSTLLDG